MNDDTPVPQTPQDPPTDGTVNNQEPEKPKQNYAFYTPSEAGYPAAQKKDDDTMPIIPQPGMIFTPTGGSVSNIQHQLNQQKANQNNTTPPQSPPTETPQQ